MSIVSIFSRTWQFLTSGCRSLKRKKDAKVTLSKDGHRESSDCSLFYEYSHYPVDVSFSNPEDNAIEQQLELPLELREFSSGDAITKRSKRLDNRDVRFDEKNHGDYSDFSKNIISSLADESQDKSECLSDNAIVQGFEDFKTIDIDLLETPLIDSHIRINIDQHETATWCDTTRQKVSTPSKYIVKSCTNEATCLRSEYVTEAFLVTSNSNDNDKTILQRKLRNNIASQKYRKKRKKKITDLLQREHHLKEEIIFKKSQIQQMIAKSVDLLLKLQPIGLILKKI